MKLVTPSVSRITDTHSLTHHPMSLANLMSRISRDPCRCHHRCHHNYYDWVRCGSRTTIDFLFPFPYDVIVLCFPVTVMFLCLPLDFLGYIYCYLLYLIYESQEEDMTTYMMSVEELWHQEGRGNLAPRENDITDDIIGHIMGWCQKEGERPICRLGLW